MISKEPIFVSVVMITYGHENYIREAIEGVLIQKVNFEIELIIADDNSPDNTESVVHSYSNHPNCHWIKYTKHKENKGMMPNFIWALNQAKGKYIALCEGDDYWTDPLKLQKQVDFLVENEDYVMCFHKTDNLLKNGKIENSKYTCIDNKDGTFEQSDLINDNFIHTPSVVFKKVFNELPYWFQLCRVGDYPLYLFLSNFGKIRYLSNTMAIYRAEAGIWSSDKSIIREKKWLEMIVYVRQIFINRERKEDFDKKYNYFWDNYSKLILEKSSLSFIASRVKLKHLILLPFIKIFIILQRIFK